MKVLEVKPEKAKVWEKGQLTIPAKIRKRLNIEEDTILTILPIGNSLVVTPEELVTPKLAREFKGAMKEKGITLKKLLKGLKEERKIYNKERFRLG